MLLVLYLKLFTLSYKVNHSGKIAPNLPGQFQKSLKSANYFQPTFQNWYQNEVNKNHRHSLQHFDRNSEIYI